jgi:hypothetical protein
MYHVIMTWHYVWVYVVAYRRDDDDDDTTTKAAGDGPRVTRGGVSCARAFVGGDCVVVCFCFWLVPVGMFEACEVTLATSSSSSPRARAAAERVAVACFRVFSCVSFRVCVCVSYESASTVRCVRVG